MTTLTLDSLLSAAGPSPLAPPRAWASGPRRGDAVAVSVRQALAAAQSGSSGLERRREARHPYPYPVYLTPLVGELPALDQTFVVIGKHLSEHGLDFYHKQPVAETRVIASLDVGAAGWLGLLLELTWCRFSRHGWYDNGGRFLSLARSPLENAA
jgi:hypothetical protein